MARARRRQVALRILRAFAILDRQRPLPILPIAVFDAQRDRRPDRLAVAHAGEEVRLVLFDPLAPAAAVSELTAVQLAPDEIQVHRHAGGKPGNPGHQGLAVRLSGGDESQHVQWRIGIGNKRRILPDAPPPVKAARSADLGRAVNCCRGCLLDAPRSGRYALDDPVGGPATGSHTMLESQASEPPSLPSVIGGGLKRLILGLQDYSLLSVQSIVNVFTPPSYWLDTLQQMDLIGVGSLPIILAAALSIGGVLVLNTASQFQRFGMTDLTGDAVSLALVRELGPTITALLVAGRNASGMASELGSMIVTEQVDAMRALGTDPIRKLMTPRVVA